jgi:hypothetical protein
MCGALSVVSDESHIHPFVAMSGFRDSLTPTKHRLGAEHDGLSTSGVLRMLTLSFTGSPVCVRGVFMSILKVSRPTLLVHHMGSKDEAMNIPIGRFCM